MQRRRLALLAASIVLATLALLLLLRDLDYPRELYWDEIFYVPDARAFFSGNVMTNAEHPPLGKFLLGAAMQLFGDRPLGWRAASVASIVLLVAILPLLLDRLELTSKGLAFAVLPSLLLLFDPLIFTAARVAALDAMLVLAYVAAALALFASLRSDRPALRVVTGALLGVALGIKWTSLTLFPLIVIFGAVRALPDKKGFAFEWKKIAQYFAPAIAIYMLIFALPGAMHFSPTAFHISMGPLQEMPWIEKFFVVHARAIKTHTAMYLSDWRSPWYAWLTCREPYWYFTKVEADDALRVIIGVGSPVFWIAGAIACVWCAIQGAAKRDRTSMLLALIPISQLALWASLPRMTFMFYMTAILPFYAIAVARMLASLKERAGAALAVALVVTSALWFLFVHPVLTADRLDAAKQARYFKSAISPLFVHRKVSVETCIESAKRTR